MSERVATMVGPGVTSAVCRLRHQQGGPGSPHRRARPGATPARDPGERRSSADARHRQEPSHLMPDQVAHALRRRRSPTSSPTLSATPPCRAAAPSGPPAAPEHPLSYVRKARLHRPHLPPIGLFYRYDGTGCAPPGGSAGPGPRANRHDRPADRGSVVLLGAGLAVQFIPVGV
jgi:hypothetical protein